MLKKIVRHFYQFRPAYLVMGAFLMTVAGLASYEKGADFYAGNPRWLLASALETPKPNPYTHGEFIVDVVKRLKKADCFEALCTDMKRGSAEEKARCELEKRDVFDKPTNYQWFDQELNRAEAIKTIVEAFQVPLNESAKQPFKDVKANTWYASHVAAAVEDGLIKDNRTHQFKPEDLAKPTWAKQVLRKADLKQLCAE